MAFRRERGGSTSADSGRRPRAERFATRRRCARPSETAAFQFFAKPEPRLEHETVHVRERRELAVGCEHVHGGIQELVLEAFGKIRPGKAADDGVDSGRTMSGGDLLDVGNGVPVDPKVGKLLRQRVRVRLVELDGKEILAVEPFEDRFGDRAEPGAVFGSYPDSIPVDASSERHRQLVRARGDGSNFLGVGDELFEKINRRSCHSAPSRCLWGHMDLKKCL